MFSRKYHLTVKGANDRLYYFFCDEDSPIGEIYDAMRTMELVVIEQIEKNKDRADFPVEVKSDESQEKCEECECQAES